MTPSGSRVTRRARVALTGIVAARDLAGVEVANVDGTPIGHLDDVLVDLGRRRIAYAVVSLRLPRPDGASRVAVPWEAMFQDGDGDRFFVHALDALEAERLPQPAGVADDPAFVSPRLARAGDGPARPAPFV